MQMHLLQLSTILWHNTSAQCLGLSETEWFSGSQGVARSSWWDTWGTEWQWCQHCNLLSHKTIEHCNMKWTNPQGRQWLGSGSWSSKTIERKMTGSPGQTRPLMWINVPSCWEKICKLIFFQPPVGIFWHWVSRGHYLLVLGGTGSVLGGTEW